MKLSNESYFSLNFIARKARPNKEGEIPIALRITMNGQRAEVYTNRYVAPNNWDASKGQSKGKTKKDLELNRYLDTIRTKICEIHNQLVMRDEMVNPDTLKKAFLGKLQKPTMLCVVLMLFTMAITGVFNLSAFSQLINSFAVPSRKDNAETITAPGGNFTTFSFAASMLSTTIGSYPARVSKPDISRRSESEASMIRI